MGVRQIDVHTPFPFDGRKAGSETVVSNNQVVADLERMRAAAVASTLDGNFVISWVAALPDTQVRAGYFPRRGWWKGRPRNCRQRFPGFHFAPSIAAFAGAGLDDVTFAIAWRGGENGIFRSRFQLFNFDGTRSGPEVAPNGHSVGEIAPVTAWC